MKPGMKMAMARYRSEQGMMGDRSPYARMGGYQNEAYRNEGYQNAGYQNGGYQNGGELPYESRMMDEGMEARRRRDSRGRYALDEQTQQMTPVEPQRVANVIGFTSRKEMEHKKEKKMQRGHASEEESFGEDMARKWVQGMINSDGTHGAKWGMEQAEKIMDMIGIDCEPAEFWAVMNAMYSDFGKVLKKYGLDQAEVYAHLAKAWLEDDDAVEDKARAYFEHVVQH